MGWVMDFADLKNASRAVTEQLDHRRLNEVEGLENPTSENIARWIWRRLKPDLPLLTKVLVQESPDSGAVYCGEED